MNKKLITISFAAIIAFTPSSSFAAKKISVTKKFEKGWWWYEEKYIDNNKTKIIKYKISPVEKAKLDKEDDTNKLLKAIIKAQKESINLQKKILEKLNYAFPKTTPTYAVNSKGEKCLANSSADCFVMPVIPEAQHVPVFKKFLRNPSPQNSKEWLKWQAKYFNHVDKIGTGLEFAFLKDGSDAYNVQTTYSYGDNPVFSKSEAALAVREARTLLAVKDNFAYFLFLGQNPFYEKLTNVYATLGKYDKTYLKDMDMVVILPSQEAKNEILNKIVPELEKQGVYEIGEFFKKRKVVVRPDLYKKYNIKVTPTVMMFYKDKKTGQKLNQIVAVGDISVDKVRHSSIRYFKYRDIVNPGEYAADKNWNIISNPVNKKLNSIPDLSAPSDFEKKEEELKKIENQDSED